MLNVSRENSGNLEKDFITRTQKWFSKFLFLSHLNSSFSSPFADFFFIRLAINIFCSAFIFGQLSPDGVTWMPIPRHYERESDGLTLKEKDKKNCSLGNSTLVGRVAPDWELSDTTY